MPRVIKVAVVGTGLAGLTAAHLLTKECAGDDVKFEIHLFEKVRMRHATPQKGIPQPDQL